MSIDVLSEKKNIMTFDNINIEPRFLNDQIYPMKKKMDLKNVVKGHEEYLNSHQTR